MSAHLPIVWTVIVNYHQPELTGQAIESVLASQGVQPRVVLVENDSDGAWARPAWGTHPSVELIVNRENLGFGAGCNQGIERALAADAQFVFLLNNDATVEPGSLALLASAAEATGLAAPKILLPDGRLYAAGGLVELARGRCRNRGIYAADGPAYRQPLTCDFASACALMITRRALASGVRFYEPFFLYYEDADFCLAMKRAGFGVRYEPSARVVHHESASTGADGGVMLEYYDARNRWVLLGRHARGLTLVQGRATLLIACTVKIAQALLHGRPAHARSRARGLRDALTGHLGPMRK